MPEGYTHIRTARLAIKEAGMLRQILPAAFCAGANGPDEFFCYQAWKPADSRQPDLPALGSRMHKERTGEFLMSLVDHAQGAAQRSYALGFLCHYITDYTLHPYVAMITEKGRLYGVPGGHGYFEIALDSELHRQDFGRRTVPVAHSNPRLTGSALAQVAQLLQACLKEVYGEEISLEALGDSFHHAHALRWLFTSRTGVKKKLFALAEPLFGEKGRLTAHVTPALLPGGRKTGLEQLPRQWRDPFTGKTCEQGVEELLGEAYRRSVTAFVTCRAYWRGRAGREQLATLLGSRSYETGQEDAASLGSGVG